MGNDTVNHPEHYTFGSVECIEAIRSALGDDGFASYCQGNAMKYLWRHRRFAAIILWKRRLQDGRYCMLDNMAKAARRLMI